MADYTLSAKITGDPSGFEKAFAVAQRTVADFDKKFEKMGKSISAVGDKLTKYITKPAVASATAIAGITLVKGWNRMIAIDNAKGKLTALGNSAEDVKEIMNNALASVKGTSYGLDEAATAAASAVAAGIKPGQKLEKYLTAVADAAAIAGTDIASMGSIFNKVQTAQRAYTEEINQLADRGIPIYQWLADEAGTTADAVRDLASEGKISSEMFFSAVEKNIGGAAKIIGSTTITGALANINAAIARIGENLFGSADDSGSIAGNILPLLNDFTAKLNDVEEKAAEAGGTLGEVFSASVGYFKDGTIHLDEMSEKAAVLTEKLKPILEKVKSITNAFSNLSAGAQIGLAGSAVAAGPLLSVIGKIITKTSSFSQTVGSVFSSVQRSIALVPSSFSSIENGLKGIVGDFKNLGSGILQPIAPLFSKVSGMIKGAFGKVSSTIALPFKNGFSLITKGLGNLVGDIGTKFPKLTGVIASFETNSKGMFSKIGSSMQSLLSKFTSFTPMFLKSLSIAGGIGVLVAGLGLLQSKFGEQIDEIISVVQTKGPEIITNLCNGITSKLPDLMEQGGTLLINLLNAITANLPAIITGGISIITALVTGLASQLPELIPEAVDMIITIVSTLAENINQIIDAGIELLLGLVDGIVASLPVLIDYVPEIIESLVNAIVENLPKILQTGIELIVTLATGLIDAIPDLVDKIPEIIDAVKEAFTSVNWGDVGEKIINGIKDGFTKISSSLVDAAKDISNKVKNIFGGSSSVSANISTKTPQLAHGTNNWSGGFAYMNEGGRGELTYLPNGSQVIPHDISVKYAKEAARGNTAGNALDAEALGQYIVSAVISQGQLQADALEKGISGMRMTVDSREAGRFMSKLGFVKT